MTNKRFILWHFYKPTLSFNTLFTIICLYGLLRNGPEFTIFILPIKFVGYACILAYQYYFSNNTYFYFRNAGFQIRHLYLHVLSLDTLICLSLSAIYLYTYL